MKNAKAVVLKIDLIAAFSSVAEKKKRSTTALSVMIFLVQS